MNDKYEKSYKTLIKRRKWFFVFTLLFPVAAGVMSTVTSENKVFVFIAVYGAILIAWSLFLYYSICPKCFGLFYGASSKNGKFNTHKFFLNSECNNCGFKISKNT